MPIFDFRCLARAHVVVACRTQALIRSGSAHTLVKPFSEPHSQACPRDESTNAMESELAAEPMTQHNVSQKGSREQMQSWSEGLVGWARDVDGVACR
eukprot:6186127-Pleurochrysis_carterae.AAC.1